MSKIMSTYGNPDVTIHNEQVLSCTGYSYKTAKHVYNYLTPIKLPKLYKRNKKTGKWMELSVKNSQPAPMDPPDVLVQIEEEGRKTRLYRSAYKVPKTKQGEDARCLLETMVSKWNKKVSRDGWSREKVDTKYKEPPLLHRWDEAEGKRKGPWLVNPKKDGVRATWYPSEWELISRKRLPFNIPHIEEALRHCNYEHEVDGELWIPGEDFQTILSIVKDKNHPRREVLQFHVFDYADMELNYLERVAEMLQMDLLKPPLYCCKPVFCETEEDVEKFYQWCLEQGYEGAVAQYVRNMWEWDKRSWEILKLKPVFSNEFQVEGVLYDYEPEVGPMIKYNCFYTKGSEVGTFKAIPSKSKQDRAKMYSDFVDGIDNPVGKYLTVEYRETTRDGAPRHAVAKGFRID